MKTILEKLATLNGQQTLVGTMIERERGRERGRGERKRIIEGNRPCGHASCSGTRFTAMIRRALLRFIRSSIHAPLSAGHNKSEALQSTAPE